ncbi:VCBS repeat-containing protein [Streptomyces sp. NPDC003038]|uniref:C40 family peptidase n=1 Tax=unclassified Streptomyces TaxID=2593676 RepID=UPI0033AF73A6
MNKRSSYRSSVVSVLLVSALGLGAATTATAMPSAEPEPLAASAQLENADADYPGAGQGEITPVPQGFRSEASLAAAAMTRSEAIKRAKSWVGKGLDYSWTNYYQGYRMDCSGYVSMAWGLSSSLTTPAFVPNGVAEWITKDELKPGDALLDDDSGAGGHVVLFEAWANSAKTSYWGYEFTPSGVHHRTIPYPYFSGNGPFQPVRMKNIVDDAVPVPEKQQDDTATRVNADFNGDGRDDVAAMYGYDDGSVALFTFLAKPDGGFNAPVKSWAVGPKEWWFEHVQLTAGDYNGDGKADLAAMYDYSDGSVAMFTFTAKADGGFNAPVKSWNVPAGQWWPEHVQLASGDFDGNGRDEVAAFYGYDDGRAALFTFKPDATGKFAAPVKSWNVPEKSWWGEHVKLAVGDFDGNGRDDVSALYGYDTGAVAMFTFKSTAAGGFTDPVKSWTVEPGNWTFANVKLTAGDYNGDGRSDVGAFYGYSDGRAALFTLTAQTDGGFNAPVKSWNVPTGQWWAENVQIASGDSDGNGRSDIAAFYGYTDGRAALFTFKPDATGKFADPVKSWNVPEKSWWGENVQLG